MFVLRAKATIDDASDALVCFGIIGDCADAALAAVFGELPERATTTCAAPATRR
jgi:folate-binding Fe-S cluster repair protein YgfZ